MSSTVDDYSTRLDEITRGIENPTPLAEAQFEQILPMLESSPGIYVHFEHFLQWLRSYLGDDQAIDLSFLENAAEIVAGNLVFVTYFLMLVLLLAFALLIWNLSHNLRSFSLPARGSEAGSSLSNHDPSRLVDVSHLSGSDRVIGIFNNILYALESHQLIKDVDSATNRELYLQLDSKGSHISLPFKALYPKIDQIVFSDVFLDAREIQNIEADLEQLMASTHE